LPAVGRVVDRRLSKRREERQKVTPTSSAGSVAAAANCLPSRCRSWHAWNIFGN
jgi:hypothetical protein